MILNCIIPDEWAISAAREAMADRAAYSEPLSPEIRITPGKNHKRGDNGVWLELPNANNYSNLAKRGRVWVRPRNWSEAANHTNLMRTLAKQLGIQYSVAKITCAFGGRVVSKRAGIVVKLRDACRFLMAWRPNLLEERRELVYNNDDH